MRRSRTRENLNIENSNNQNSNNQNSNNQNSNNQTHEHQVEVNSGFSKTHRVYDQAPIEHEERQGITKCWQLGLVFSAIFANGIAATALFYMWRFCGESE
jgi:hypothetical protein